MLNFNQKTLKDTIKLNGIGLHNGVNVNLTIKPAKENFGIKFCRIDIEKNNLIEANYKNVTEPVLCTKIKNNNGVTVSTVEHLMAAFFGEGIDNALVEIDAAEVPILDGSAIEFVEAIRSVGVKEQNEQRKFISVKKRVEIKAYFVRFLFLRKARGGTQRSSTFSHTNHFRVSLTSSLRTQPQKCKQMYFNASLCHQKLDYYNYCCYYIPVMSSSVVFLYS